MEVGEGGGARYAGRWTLLRSRPKATNIKVSSSHCQKLIANAKGAQDRQ